MKTTNIFWISEQILKIGTFFEVLRNFLKFQNILWNSGYFLKMQILFSFEHIFYCEHCFKFPNILGKWTLLEWWETNCKRQGSEHSEQFLEKRIFFGNPIHFLNLLLFICMKNLSNVQFFVKIMIIFTKYFSKIINIFGTCEYCQNLWTFYNCSWIFLNMWTFYKHMYSLHQLVREMDKK